MKINKIFTYRLFSACLSLVLAVSFSVPVHAQEVLYLTTPGAMLSTNVAYVPPIVRGIKIYPENPLRFDFIIDSGDDNLAGEELKKESMRLVKYFLASMTIPEDEMWVNLSPYEKDRIIPNSFGQTEMGRDLLVQDYLLKQFTSSLMNPETRLGDEFWKRVYAKAQELYGTTEIPVNTFNKVWIVPDKARVYVDGKNVFVVDSHLKVMLQEDYLALESNAASNTLGLDNVKKSDQEIVSGVSSEVIRNVLIPEIEKEVNEGKTFSQLRQIFNSMILAVWYKKNLKESLLGQLYVNQNKIKGVEVKDKSENQKIYNQYVEAFEKGVYNFIKEDYDEASQQLIPRKYFSGGITAQRVGEKLVTEGVSGQKERSSRIGEIIGNFKGVVTMVSFLLLSSCPGGGCSVLLPNISESNQPVSADVKNEMVLDPAKLDKFLESIAAQSNIPASLLVTPKEKIETVENLNGFEVLPDAHARLGAVVLQAGDYLGLAMVPEIVSKLRDDVKIVVLTPDQYIADILLNEFKNREIPDVEQRVRFMIGGQLSAWSRDPYIVLFNPKTAKFTLFSARGDAGTQLNTGVGWEIMKKNIGWDDMVSHDVRDESLDLQGGDVRADDTYVYVGKSTIHYSQYNSMGLQVKSQQQVIERIEEVTGKKVIVLSAADDIHNDRYHNPLGKTKYGENTNLLADPVAVLEIFASMSFAEKEEAINNILLISEGLPAEVTKAINREILQELFNVTPDKIRMARASKFVQGLEKVKKDLEARGIVVRRVPGMPFEFSGSPFGIYPTNVIMDYPAGEEKEIRKPSVIVPHYGIPKLDAAVDRIYEQLDFDVRPVPGVLAGFYEGGPRCLTQTIGYSTEFLNVMSNSELKIFLERTEIKGSFSKERTGRDYPAFQESIGLGKKEAAQDQEAAALNQGGDAGRSSPVNDVGGIDLNPGMLELQTERDTTEFYLPYDANQIKGINIDGFSPSIINVVPNVNLHMLISESSGIPSAAVNQPANIPVSSL